ncbi:ABC transporter permease [Sporosarcina sp. G11-34]|uniref:ABC transporter permease n=1 Tax=Sporosarcina sp. G11-34 TaxID=2849605 RepID=UPI0022A949FD|nr:ABC transporter permease [Sporosarcina sp. G11-34]MCZ2260157.1 ABC transporter permease [Sporosarcina sp. G11-34]
MAKLLLNRGITAIIVLLGSLLVVFSINYFLPTDVVDTLLAENAGNTEMADNLRKELGLHLPFYTQFFNYIMNLLQGDFGQSVIDGEPVLDKIIAQFPATLMLTLASITISIVVGVTLGVLAAIHQNSFIDYVARLIGLLGISMPTFWSGILLILIFSVSLGWFPAMGSVGIASLVLPAITLGLVGAGFVVRVVRNSMLEVINETYIATLRAKGISERIVMYRHALRNALIPAITMIGVIIGDFLGGTVVIETVFARQGIGRMVADAIMAKDLPIIQGVVFFIAIVYVVINLCIDISYSVIDPRIRRGQLGGN